MNVKTAGRVARSLAQRSRSLDNLAGGYIGPRRSYWGGPASANDIDENIAAELRKMSEEQERIQKALENAVVVVNLGGGE